jgi:SAM-dependent methyltransferase
MAKHTSSSLQHLPKVFGIVFALKGDTLSDKRVAAHIAQDNELAALRVALGTASKTHRVIAVLLYLSKKKLNWIPSLELVLTMCWLVGPARSWFRYLLRSHERDTLQAATRLIHQYGGLNKRTLDVGCGIGHLPQQFPVKKGHEWVCIDKNFFSLFLAQMYHGRPDITYVCGDIEIERLFSPKEFDTVVCLDCFAWIFQKAVFTQQVHSILSSPGQFIMVNVHEEQVHTLGWGYGIKRKEVAELTRLAGFKQHTWYHHHSNDQTPVKRLSELNPSGYSFVAKK